MNQSQPLYPADPTCPYCNGFGSIGRASTPLAHTPCICRYVQDLKLRKLAHASLKKVLGKILQELREQGEEHELVKGVKAIVDGVRRKK